jgi:hypothetical protein
VGTGASSGWQNGCSGQSAERGSRFFDGTFRGMWATSLGFLDEEMQKREAGCAEPPEDVLPVEEDEVGMAPEALVSLVLDETVGVADVGTALGAVTLIQIFEYILMFLLEGGSAHEEAGLRHALIRLLEGPRGDSLLCEAEKRTDTLMCILTSIEALNRDRHVSGVLREGAEADQVTLRLLRWVCAKKAELTPRALWAVVMPIMFECAWSCKSRAAAVEEGAAALAVHCLELERPTDCPSSPLLGLVETGWVLLDVLLRGHPPKELYALRLPTELLKLAVDDLKRIGAEVHILRVLGVCT